MNEYDLVYMAGFFDGEGCIMISSDQIEGEYINYTMRVATVQTGQRARQFFEQLKINYGGFINVPLKKKSYHSIVYRWVIKTQKACKFLQQIYPYLKFKKEQAKLAIEIQEKLSENIGKTHPSDEEKIEKYSYYETAKQEMHFLNRRGSNY